MRRLLCAILCFCMLISILPATVFATTWITIFNVTVTEPKVGEKPAYDAKVPETASTYVTKTKWSGEFDENGCFQHGYKYTVSVSVKIKDGQNDKYIKHSAGNAKVNGNVAKLKDISTNLKEAVVEYTFNLGAPDDTLSPEEIKDLNTAIYKDLSLVEFEWEVLRLCNIERAKAGLDSLSMIGTLQYCCDIREEEIAARFSHTRPNDENFVSVVPSSFSCRILGENIAQGQASPAAVMKSWMNSPGHRANILKPDYDYMGVGYNPDGNYWVQLFADSTSISRVKSSSTKQAFLESEMKDVRLSITTSNGYVSHIPADFASMKQDGDKYYPMLDAKTLPEFTKLEPGENPEETTPVEPDPDEDKTPDINDEPDSGTLFDRYIPIEQVYATDFFVSTNLTPKTFKFNVGTRFLETTTSAKPSFAPKVKRSEYAGHYVKVNYLGTYGTVGKDIAVTQLGIIKEEEYEKVMNGEESAWAKAYNLTKDTIIISVDIYDANKNFVRALSKACVIVAASDDGSFITFSNYLGSASTVLFSQTDNFFKPEDDKDVSYKGVTLIASKIMLDQKSDAEKLLPPTEKTVYEFKTYPKLYGYENYNANHLLTYNEFVTPENVYYQIGLVTEGIEPGVANEIKDVVNYSYYCHYLGTAYKQRNIVTADGTLYGVTTKYEKKTIATNVKKAIANHYLTNNGEVVELKGGKIIATNCVDIEESNDGLVIGILKKDGTFHMGYTYLAGEDSYAKGINKMLDNAKYIVPNAVIDKDNTLYRWDNETKMTGIDMDAFVNGEVISTYETKLSVIKVCENVARIFPYEYLTKIFAHDEKYINQSIYGFAQTEKGTLYGYSSTYHQSFGKYNNKIERIFPAFTSDEMGNFVGIKVENEAVPYAIMANYNDSNIYRWGQLIYTDVLGDPLKVPYVCETLGGYYGEDGIVYGVDEKFTPTALSSHIVSVGNRYTDLPQMYRRTATYRAYNRDEDSNIPLLPNVYTWKFESKRIILLERTDGSVWTADVLHPSTAADLIAMTGGYESSNVVQISKATAKKGSYEYIDKDAFVSGVDPECTHSWKDATCTEPKTCTICGVTDGDKLAHTFDQEKVDPKYLVSEGVYYKSCVCGATGTETFTVKEDKPEEKPEVKPEEKPEDKPVINFKDVPTSAFYYDAVMWAVGKGVTTGTGADTFSPDAICNRGQVVTFLWRAAGQPEPKDTTNPFTDVKSGDFFYKAVLWAKENGITTGTSATAFSPNENCNRGQVVTFLSRALKGTPKNSNNPFNDVAAGAFYYNPVLWAVENGITAGTGNGTFSPNADCNRGQVITFLYRAYK